MFIFVYKCLYMRPRITETEYEIIKNLRKVKNRILVIGDIHEPYSLDGYREFCMSIYKKYNCNQVVFLGDILDLHYSSFHESNPDGHSAGDEFEKAYSRLKKWHEVFPVAKLCIGNHDAIPNRKAFSGGLSKKWIKSIGEVLNFDGWEFAESWTIDGVLYCHGIGRKARNRAKSDIVSVVQGHYHSESYIESFGSPNNRIFAMQVGCGIDWSSFAFDYCRHYNAPHICCGVVIDKLPILEYYEESN